MIQRSDYADWQEFYWNYQNILAKQYLIPMIEQSGYKIDAKKVIEIGCGSGGVIEAFAERALSAVGIDIHPFDYTKLSTSKVKYITADIYDLNVRATYSDQYDIIILRDVIEHLPNKQDIFGLFNELLSSDGIVFVTFPPYFSPFGAHQQVFSKNILGKLPYVHLLPKPIYLNYVKNIEKNNMPAYQTALELENSKTTIMGLRKYIKKYNFKIVYQDYYLVRPSYEIRYGYKPRKVNYLKFLPVINELFVLGVYMILQRKK